jgi:predicted lactoylglutathione lyase
LFRRPRRQRAENRHRLASERDSRSTAHMKRINFLTLGVRDLSRSKKFLNELFGWKDLPQPSAEVAFYDMGGWVLSLFGWDDLAKDASVAAKGDGFRGLSIASNVAEKADVATTLEKARQLGAEFVQPAHDVFWGRHTGYFRDLDGHVWEVAWNPGMPVTPDGFVDLSALKAASADGAPKL